MTEANGGPPRVEGMEPGKAFAVVGQTTWERMQAAMRAAGYTDEADAFERWRQEGMRETA